jgi:hypothetical protein
MPSYYKVKAQKKYAGDGGGSGGDGVGIGSDAVTAAADNSGNTNSNGDVGTIGSTDATATADNSGNTVGPGDGDSAGTAGGPNDDVIVKYTGPLASDKIATRATSAENFIAIPKSTYMTNLATQKAITPENIFTVYNPKATTGGK